MSVPPDTIRSGAHYLVRYDARQQVRTVVEVGATHVVYVVTTQREHRTVALRRFAKLVEREL